LTIPFDRQVSTACATLCSTITVHIEIEEEDRPCANIAPQQSSTDKFDAAYLVDPPRNIKPLRENSRSREVSPARRQQGRHAASETAFGSDDGSAGGASGGRRRTRPSCGADVSARGWPGGG
jgi:antitoxin (DNA-binding transcriptional repressor) of toxin-antitoxin stability system